MPVTAPALAADLLRSLTEPDQGRGQLRPLSDIGPSLCEKPDTTRKLGQLAKGLFDRARYFYECAKAACVRTALTRLQSCPMPSFGVTEQTDNSQPGTILWIRKRR